MVFFMNDHRLILIASRVNIPAIVGTLPQSTGNEGLQDEKSRCFYHEVGVFLLFAPPCSLLSVCYYSQSNRRDH